MDTGTSTASCLNNPAVSSSSSSSEAHHDATWSSSLSAASNTETGWADFSSFSPVRLEIQIIPGPVLGLSIWLVTFTVLVFKTMRLIWNAFFVFQSQRPSEVQLSCCYGNQHRDSGPPGGQRTDASWGWDVHPSVGEQPDLRNDLSLSSVLQKVTTGWAPAWFLLLLHLHQRTAGPPRQERLHVASSGASQRPSSTAPWKKPSVSPSTPRLRRPFLRGSLVTSTQKHVSFHLSELTEHQGWHIQHGRNHLRHPEDKLFIRLAAFHSLI